jgi:RluA family pseudouridine synthase
MSQENRENTENKQEKPKETEKEKIREKTKEKAKEERVETIRLSPKLTIPIIYEDRHLLAINKPSGYLIAPLQWEQTSRNLMLMLREGIDIGAPWARRRVLRFIANIHRLDADTSGALLLAKNRTALSQMTERFERRQVDKAYLALVKGVFDENTFSTNAPIAEHPKILGKMVVDKRFGKEALTHFVVEKRFSKYTLLKAYPVTGRTHQIRIHLAWLGIPIVNDLLYNEEAILEQEQETNSNPFPMERLALHASELKFKHPLLPKKVIVQAPFPIDFAKSIQLLEKAMEKNLEKASEKTT